MPSIQDFYAASANKNHYLVIQKTNNQETVLARPSRFFKKSDAATVLTSFRTALKKENGPEFYRRLPDNLRQRLDNLAKNGLGVKELIQKVKVFSENDQSTIRNNDSYVKNNFTPNNFRDKFSNLLECQNEHLSPHLKNLDINQVKEIQSKIIDFLQKHYIGVMPDLTTLQEADRNRIFGEALRFGMSASLEDLAPLRPSVSLPNALPNIQALPADTKPYGLLHFQKEPKDVAYARQHLNEKDAGLEKAGYKLVGSKLNGVEPGFAANKRWSTEDRDKLLNPEHSFAHGAVGVLMDSMSDDKVKRLATQLWAGHTFLTRQDCLKLIRNFPANTIAATDLMKEEFKRLSEAMARQPIAPEDEMLVKLMEIYTVNQQAKFNNAHYVKLDYNEMLLGRYTIAARAHKGVFYNLVHRLMRLNKPRDINRSAVTELLANDITRSFGIETQKLKLVHAQYPNGTSKLLLDGAHMRNPLDSKVQYSDLDASLSQTNRAYEGVLVKPQEVGQPLEVDTGIDQLGRNKIFLLALADRDAVGSNGQNKGRLGNQFASIDPGKSLNTKAMAKRDLRNDMAVDASVYKNFSIFDQSPFSERMEGVRDLVKTLSDDIESAQTKIFKQYADQFGPSATNELNFTQALTAISNGYQARVNYVKDTFTDRLAVYDWKLSAEEALDSEPNKEFHSQTLNTLDMLEKISSKGVTLQSGGIKLEQPSVPYKNRQEWRVTELPGDPSKVVFAPVGGSSRAAMQRLQDFAQTTFREKWKEEMEEKGITVHLGSGSSDNYITVLKVEMKAANETFSVDALREYLHPAGN